MESIALFGVPRKMQQNPIGTERRLLEQSRMSTSKVEPRHRINTVPFLRLEANRCFVTRARVIESVASQVCLYRVGH